MTQVESGIGKVFKGEEFIAEVRYKIQIREYRRGAITAKKVLLEFDPAELITAQFGADPLTLHMSDGKKQKFFVTSSDGQIETTGGPQ
jgi:hypothetical protein